MRRRRRGSAASSGRCRDVGLRRLRADASAASEPVAAVLERLAALRAVHEDAAATAESLKRAELEQAALADRLAANDAALKRLAEMVQGLVKGGS